MAQQRQFHMVVGGAGAGNNVRKYHDTTYTKLFVGGLAWETQRDTMRSYFDQFGEILEAVVITDNNTGKSKGYGFVTFKEPEAAFRACQNPAPVIDGRKANCNLASFGAQKPKPPPPPPPPPQHGPLRSRAAPGLLAHQLAYGGPSTSYFHQPSAHLSFPYSAYGYIGYPHGAHYPVNYYGGQQTSSYYTAGAAGAVAAAGHFHNFYPYYPPHAAQSSQASGIGVQFPYHMLQQHYPILQQLHFTSSGISSLPPHSSSIPLPSTIITTTTGATVTAPVAGSGLGPPQANVVVSEKNSSSTS